MDLKHVTVAGIPTLLRDDLPTPGSTAMFFPSDGEAGAQWLRYAAFDTPSAVIAGRAQAFVQEPHDIALGLLELLPRPTPTSSFILFGYSAGTVVACLAALALLEIEPAAPVRLILANPFAEWWPPTSWQHMPWAKPVLDQVEADPKLRARFEQRGDGHEILRRAAAKGLRTAIILSGQNPADRARATPIAEAARARIITVPTDDHNLMHWLLPQMFARGRTEQGMARLERRLAAQHRILTPEVPKATIEQWARDQSQTMKAFWQTWPGLQALADHL